jgi:hypothetical protein
LLPVISRYCSKEALLLDLLLEVLFHVGGLVHDDFVIDDVGGAFHDLSHDVGIVLLFGFAHLVSKEGFLLVGLELLDGVDVFDREIFDRFVGKSGICFSLISWTVILKVASLPARSLT